MKKLISLILAIALCLTVFSAFAEVLSPILPDVLPMPTGDVVIESGIKDANGADIVKIAVGEDSDKASEEFLNAVTSGEYEVNLSDTLEVLGLTDAQSIVCIPLPEITVEADAVTAENEETKVTLKYDITAASAEYLKSSSGLVAVFTYLKGDTIYSVVADFEVNGTTILCNIPLAVLADASGCPAFIDFVTVK